LIGPQGLCARRGSEALSRVNSRFFAARRLRTASLGVVTLARRPVFEDGRAGGRGGSSRVPFTVVWLRRNFHRCFGAQRTVRGEGGPWLSPASRITFVIRRTGFVRVVDLFRVGTVRVREVPLIFFSKRPSTASLSGGRRDRPGAKGRKYQTAADFRGGPAREAASKGFQGGRPPMAHAGREGGAVLALSTKGGDSAGAASCLDGGPM